MAMSDAIGNTTAATDEALMATRASRQKIIIDDLDFSTSRMSELARYVAFGLAAFTVLLMTSNSPSAQAILKAHERLILICSALGCLSIVFDYLQYFFAYKSSHNAMKKFEENQGDYFAYQADEVWRRGRIAFFWLKQVATICGSLLFIVVVLMQAFEA